MEKPQNIDKLFTSVFALIKAARRKVYNHADAVLVETNWQIGRSIIEEEQNGESRAGYGKSIIQSLAAKLSASGEKGFDGTNLRHMRNFYLQYPNCDALRRELSWTHYRQLLRISEPQKRSFYEIECAKSNWATRELDRQINSMLYERLALSRDKEGIMQLSTQGAEPTQPVDIIKDPFMLEFLGLSEQTKYLEKDLEQALIDKLQLFLLELGRGFSFVARQKRISLDGESNKENWGFFGDNIND